MKGFDYSKVKEEEALYDNLRPLGKIVANLTS